MDKVKLGIVGVGNRGFYFLKLACENPLAQVVAIADENEERMRRAVALVGAPLSMYKTPDELFEKAKVDAVIVATPDYLHKKHAIAAFKAGKHLLLEKPIATKVPDALAVFRAARRSDRVLAMGFNLRYAPVFNKMHSLVADEKLVGAPFYMSAVEYYGGGRTYMARWNRLKKFTGGLWIHKGTHDFDLLNWMAYPARPKWVCATAAVNALDSKHLPFELRPGEEIGPYCQACKYNRECPDRADYMTYGRKEGPAPLFDEETAKSDGYHKDLCIFLSNKDTHDNGICIIEYDNGSRAFHTEVFVTARENRRYTVIGDRGHLEADLEGKSIVLYPRWTKNTVTYNIQGTPGEHGGADPKLVDTFLRAILSGERPLAGAIDGIWSMAVGVAAEMSRDENRVVQLSEILDPKTLA